MRSNYDAYSEVITYIRKMQDVDRRLERLTDRRRLPAFRDGRRESMRIVSAKLGATNMEEEVTSFINEETNAIRARLVAARSDLGHIRAESEHSRARHRVGHLRGEGDADIGRNPTSIQPGNPNYVLLRQKYVLEKRFTGNQG